MNFRPDYLSVLSGHDFHFGDFCTVLRPGVGGLLEFRIRLSNSSPSVFICVHPWLKMGFAWLVFKNRQSAIGNRQFAEVSA